MTPLPLSLVRSGREITEPRLAPDGRSVGFVQRWRGGASINTVPILGARIEQQWTFGIDPSPGRGLGGGCFDWLASGSELGLVYAGRDGELWRQSGFELERLTDHGSEVRGPATDRAGRRVVYVVGEAEVWLRDLVDGTHHRLDDGRHAFCFDPSITDDGDRVAWTGWSPPDMAWDGSVRVDHELESGSLVETALVDGAVQQPRFASDGRPVHVHDASGWLNVYLDGRPVIAEQCEHAGPTWGMGNRSYAIDPAGERVAFTRNETGYGSINIVGLASGRVEQLGRGVHGHLTWDGQTLVAVRSGARTPPQIVAYDTSGRRSTLVVSQVAAWPTDELPEPALIEAPSDDGEFALHARRFEAGHGRLLVWVHGGPTDQWQVEWRPRIAYWWSRGWDVLVVDPRGTTGHGRRYQQALHGRWGRADVDDTATLIRHAHAAGLAAPETTVVIGGSSGGLTVLGVLADHAELVAGGVASYPVSDLKALTEVTHRFEAHYTDTLVAPCDGSSESEARFRELSPIHRAERIAGPLLLLHGTEDPVVPIGQSESLVERLTEAGGEVEFVVYEGEGHGFRQPEHVADEYVRTESFLDRLVPGH